MLDKMVWIVNLRLPVSMRFSIEQEVNLISLDMTCSCAHEKRTSIWMFKYSSSRRRWPMQTWHNHWRMSTSQLWGPNGLHDSSKSCGLVLDCIKQGTVFCSMGVPRDTGLFHVHPDNALIHHIWASVKYA